MPPNAETIARHTRPIIVRIWCDRCDLLRMCELIVEGKDVLTLCEECKRSRNAKSG